MTPSAGTSVLPYWLSVLDALAPLFAFLGTVAIGIVAAWIAHGQWRTTRDKLRLDLFDRRVKVYEAARKFIAEIARNPNAELDRRREYLLATSHAPFIFDDPRVAEYLDLLAKQEIVFNTVASLVERQNRGMSLPAEHKSAPEKKWELLRWFVEQEKVIDEKFAPYLRLKA